MISSHSKPDSFIIFSVFQSPPKGALCVHGPKSDFSSSPVIDDFNHPDFKIPQYRTELMEPLHSEASNKGNENNVKEKEEENRPEGQTGSTPITKPIPLGELISSHLDFTYRNLKNYQTTKKYFNSLEVEFQEVEGVYKGEREKSFLVSAKMTEFIVPFLNKFKQECCLLLTPSKHGNYKACFIFPDGSKERKGYWVEVPKQYRESWKEEKGIETGYTEFSDKRVYTILPEPCYMVRDIEKAFNLSFEKKTQHKRNNSPLVLETKEMNLAYQYN